jgi:4-carboxymuconolactone decarboxylase
MTRIVMPAALTEEQQRVVDETVAGLRGRVPAPLVPWLASPELASRAQRLGEFVRFQTSLPPRLSELAILVTARFWTAQYEWYAHKKLALKTELDPAIIDDIAARRAPRFRAADEQIVYDFSRRLHENHTIDADLYRLAVETLGEQAVVELVGILGYYTLVSMTLNVFEIGLPDGASPELTA